MIYYFAVLSTLAVLCLILITGHLANIASAYQKWLEELQRREYQEYVELQQRPDQLG